jgi:hypothetical protein
MVQDKNEPLFRMPFRIEVQEGIKTLYYRCHKAVRLLGSCP